MLPLGQRNCQRFSPCRANPERPETHPGRRGLRTARRARSAAASGPRTRGRSEFSCPSCRSYGYTYIDTGVPNALPAGISPLQGGEQLVTFFVGVEDIAATIAEVKGLGGSVVQEPARVPGVAFALIADPSGQVVGLAQQG
jgi:hypothetical protein